MTDRDDDWRGPMQGVKRTPRQAMRRFRQKCRYERRRRRCRRATGVAAVIVGFIVAVALLGSFGAIPAGVIGGVVLIVAFNLLQRQCPDRWGERQ